jgi:aspartyl-tRNA(Asn)/glutamyl-tRNA(Gln) amidotransferase subunit C
MLTLDQVTRIAHLARLELAAGELETMQREMNAILAMVDEMAAVDTAGVEPMAHAVEMSQRLREDRVTETDQHALFQGVAPQVEDGLYLVPRVIE